MTAREVLLTGVTGFVGPHVIEELAGRSCRVRALVRQSSNTQALRDLGIALTVTELSDTAALKAAMADVDVVIHMAALTHARTESELTRVNRDGTAALADAAAESGRVLRFVYLSSLAAVGPSDGRPVTADDEPHPLTAYGRSKLAGEAALQTRSVAMQTVTLRAAAVYGPGDRELLRFFRLAKVGALPIPAGPARPLQLVHVKDLARAIADAALHEGELGGTYHIADPRAYPWKDVCGLVGDAVGRKPVFLPVPQTAIAMAAAVSEAMSSALGRSTMFNRDKVRELLAPGWLCETDGARQAFGFSAEIPLPAGLRNTADWYRSKGWL
ncbi:MAG: NAD-dependent epimerase/dehydratase family protein [Longimicrobiales bacterium]